MPEIPEKALKEATAAYWCAYHSGVPHEEIPRVVVQAAAGGIREDERRNVAEEIAQPLIAKAQQDAEAAVARARDKQRRADDIVTELRRQIRVLESSREEQRQRAVKAEEANTAVRRLCEFAISIACDAQSAEQARETLATLDRCEV